VAHHINDSYVSSFFYIVYLNIIFGWCRIIIWWFLYDLIFLILFDDVYLIN
jgi:hypothetical protein